MYPKKSQKTYKMHENCQKRQKNAIFSLKCFVNSNKTIIFAVENLQETGLFALNPNDNNVINY